MEKNQKISEQQIAEWKNEHGEVFVYEVDDKKCYLSKPSRKVISAAASLSKGDSIKHNEIMLKNCFLGGDREIMDNDSLFLGISMKLSELIDIKEGELKKL